MQRQVECETRLAVELLEDRYLLAGWSPGDFLVADPGGDRIAVFDEDFVFRHYLDEDFPSVSGMDFLPGGNLVAASQGTTPEVRQYAPDGSLVSSFSHAALGTPFDIKASEDNLLYVGTDDPTLGISEFDLDGNLLRNFGVGVGYTGVAVLPSGEIWAGDLDRVGFIDVFDVATGDPLPSIALDNGQTRAETMTLGSVISYDPITRTFFRRSEDGSFVQDYPSPSTGASILGVATDGAFVYATVVVSSGLIFKWDLDTGAFSGSVNISNDVQFPFGITHASTLATGVEIAIEKTATQSDVVEGEVLTYTIRVTNSGTETAVDVSVQDSLPDGVTFLSTSGCSEDPNMASGSIVTCSLGDIPADEFRELELLVLVDADYISGGMYGDTITNTAEVLVGDGNTDFDNAIVETPVLPAGSITIVKTARPADEPQDFHFEGSFGPFDLDDDSDPTLEDTITFAGLRAGAFSLTEMAVDGWQLASITCDDANSTGNVGTATATIMLETGEHVTCEFTNDKLGSITIVKDAEPDGPQDFDFDGGLGHFSLDDDSEATLPNSRTFTDLPPGSYEVTEDLAAGWNLSHLVCVDPTFNSSEDVASRTATVILDPGEAVTCSFTNQRLLTDVEMTEKFLLDSPSNASPPRPIAEGDLLGYAIDVRNNGPATATNVVIVDALPTSMTLLGAVYSFRGPLGSTEPTSCTLPCAIPELAAGDEVRVFIEVRVDQVGEFTNTAVVVASNDSTPDNNSDSVTVTVHPAVDAGGPYTVEEGGTVILDGTCDSCTENSWNLDGDSSFETPGQSVAFGATDLPAGGYPVGYQGCTALPGIGSICNEEYTTVTVVPVAVGTITIVKDAQPDGPQDFDFTGELGQFTLDDDNDATLPNSRTFTVSPGFIFIQEIVPLGWSVQDIDCDANSADDGPNVTVQVDAGAHVTCTFKNVKLGSIEIIKSASPEGPQDFDFDGGLGHFSLDDDSDPTLLNSRFVDDVVPGTYAVTESIAPGWDLTLIQCFDPTGDTQEDLAGRTATINVAPGEDVTCIFTNTQRGRVTIVKDAEPNDPQDFDFDGDFEHFSLDDDNEPALANQRTFTDVIPGTYEVHEQAAPGWVLQAVTCDDGNSFGFPVSQTARIRVEPGEHVTCVFTNQKLLGTITIIKDALPDGPQDFDFDGGLGHFTLDDDGDPTLSDRIVRDDLVPGTYTVTEMVPPGWRLVRVNCDGVDMAGPSVSVELEANEDITCVFFNVQLSTVTVVKEFVPDIPDDVTIEVSGSDVLLKDFVAAFLNFTTVSGPFADPSPPDKVGIRDDQSKTFDLTPGIYELSESVINFFFDPISIECTDPTGDTAVDVAAGKALIDLGPTEHVTCVFTNEVRGVVKIVKEADPQSTASFEFVGIGDGPFLLSDATQEQRQTTPPGFPLPPEEREFNLPPGAYNVQELVPDGWFLNGIQCTEEGLLGNATPTTVDDSSGTAMIGLDSFEVVTCTYFNIDLPPDTDDDGLTDDFENGFGGDGVSVSGANSVSSTGDAASGSTITADDVTVTLPPGTMSSTPETEVQFTISTVPPAAAISGVVLPAGATKSIELPIGGQNAVCIDDSPTATIESVATGTCASPQVQVGVPAAVGDSLTSGQYLVTRTSDTHVRVDGLTHSAVAMITSSSDAGDGNVTARVRFGFALIEGDGGDNSIRITPGSTSNSLVVTGSGTTVNGQTGPVQIGGILFGFSMDLKGGDDRVVFEGQSIPLIGGSVRTGSGDDLVRFQSFSSSGGNFGLLLIDTGDGHDQVIVQDSHLPAGWFDLGGGNDRFTALDSVFGGPTAVLTKDGDDAVVLEATRFRKAALIALGGGTDSLRIGSPADPTRASQFDEALALIGDGGFDALDAGVLSTPNAYGNDLDSPLILGFEQFDS